ncbi:MAG: 3'-5' exonuclease [Chloroflexi bacterium]|jgi:DNA polymerase-3 subunit epsilon|nr:3'-5' exonuclease [Chloroflexota bacterium]
MYPLANPKVIQRARQVLAYNPIFLDTETTGFSPQDVIIEVGVVDLSGNTLYETLVKPPIPIPAESIAVHGIRDAMVANAPSWLEAWEGLQQVLAGRFIGTYNADFDLRMLKQTHARYWQHWPLDDQLFFCVMKLYSAFYGQVTPHGNSYRFHKLEAAGADSGIPLPNSHRAVDDAKITAALFNHIANYTS